mmetsp:Transcript_12011/g.20277  ORF Transcript_12011/g.20277 Transcript_12011/m.20277 type:complete len:434 (+) Transcript_12011:1505-2806(+)
MEALSLEQKLADSYEAQRTKSIRMEKYELALQEATQSINLGANVTKDQIEGDSQFDYWADKVEAVTDNIDRSKELIGTTVQKLRNAEVDIEHEIKRQEQKRLNTQRRNMLRLFGPMIFNNAALKYLQLSAIFLLAGKCLALASPFILKCLIDSISAVSISKFGTAIAGFGAAAATKAAATGAAAKVATGVATGVAAKTAATATAAKAAGSTVAAAAVKMGLWKVSIGVLLFGASKIASTILVQNHVIQMTKLIQEGLERVSQRAFSHLHELDLGFHKQSSSRDSVFAINRALRSLDSGLRFFLCFFSGMIVESAFLATAIGWNCGPIYLLNMVATMGAYIAFSYQKAQERMEIVREKKNKEKVQEIFQGESIQNYESVKAFGTESFERKRYDKITSSVKDQAIEGQRTLTELNIGQDVIFYSGLTLNLLLSAL